MKILHICAISFTVKNLLLPQLNYFIEQGLTVDVACSPSADSDALRRQGYTIHDINIDRKISPASNLKSILDLFKLMRSHRYDLVHVHTPIASVLGRIAAKLAGVPQIVYTAHGFYFHENMSPRKYHFFHTIERVSGWLTDLTLTQSQEDLKTATETHINAPNQLQYLGNGVDLTRFNRQCLDANAITALKQALAIPEQAAPIMAMTGRITQEKGYLELVTALAQLRSEFPQMHLLVIGGQLSSERDAFQLELSRVIETLGLDNNITFTGFRSDVPELLGLVDMFVLPSYREGLPRSILEAMAMALPVITTDIRGCREAVVDGVTGLIVPPRDSDALAQALEQVSADVALRKRLGQAGRQRVEAEFDERLVFKRLHSAYHALGVL